MHDKILKKKLQYTFSGTVCDVFKGGTHHGALGLSFRLTTLDTSKCLFADDRLYMHAARSAPPKVFSRPSGSPVQVFILFVTPSPNFLNISCTTRSRSYLESFGTHTAGHTRPTSNMQHPTNMATSVIGPPRTCCWLLLQAYSTLYVAYRTVRGVATVYPVRPYCNVPK